MDLASLPIFIFCNSETKFLYWKLVLNVDILFFIYLYRIMPLAIALNRDKILHLASKRTIRLSKMRVLNFFSVCVYASTVEIFIRISERLMLFSMFNQTGHWDRTLLFFIQILTQFQCSLATGKDIERKDYAIVICLISINHY